LADETKFLGVRRWVLFFIKDLLRKRMVNDTISDVLTRIRNGCLIKSQSVSIPLTRLSQQICHTLEKEGFIESFQRDSDRQLTVELRYKGPEKKPCITNLRRISKPGLRVYTSKKQMPPVLGGMGILVLSTSQGIMTDREAKFRGIGGEILCSIW
jgi:small subunit ribosomal protein S8